MTIRDELLAFGYSEARIGKWVKPVGFHLFSFNEETQQWANWFKDFRGKLSCYESHLLKSDKNFLLQIRGFEAWTRINTPGIDHADFRISYFDL